MTEWQVWKSTSEPGMLKLDFGGLVNALPLLAPPTPPGRLAGRRWGRDILAVNQQAHRLPATRAQAKKLFKLAFANNSPDVA